MKGDFTRSTFDPKKHYHGVRMQQGRVQLDADWNEQVDISSYRTEVGAADVIGECGAPIDNAGFALTNGATPQITPGRYYVDGILCENEAPLDLDKQPDLPGFTLPAAGAAAQSYLVYLDVWQRHMTALDDALLREVALGGPDTATRSRTVWQVKLLGPVAGAVNCLTQPPGWKDLVNRRDGTQLNARARENPGDVGQCDVAAGSGYRRLENQLYRVEVHQGGSVGANPQDAAGATFKWSRDNGSIVARWKGKVGDDLIVDSIGRDDVLRFTAGQWVELIDDQRELNGLPGTLVQLLKAEGAPGSGAALTIDPGTASGPVELADFGRNLKIRRWDHVGTTELPLRGGAVPVVEGTGDNGWTPLEEGVEVQFQPGGAYKTGDYWLIPARTNTADIEWPRSPADAAVTVPKRRDGMDHHMCPLGIVQRTAQGFTFTDCRNLFPPLTELTVLHYAGGDGQQAGAAQALPFPLRVRVLNGENPVAGAPVRFAVLDGGGTLGAANPVLTAAPDGVAEMGWQLGPSGPQRVEAALLDSAGNPLPGQRVQFDATVAVAGGKGCCTCVGPGADYDSLQAALADLLNKGQREICICMLGGQHVVDVSPMTGEKFGEKPIRIKITGCGEGTTLQLKQPLVFQRISTVGLRDLAVRPQFPVDSKTIPLDFNQCAEVTVENCSIVGITPSGALMRIVDADKARVAASQFEAARPESFQAAVPFLDKIAGAPGGDILAGLFKSGAVDREQFLRMAQDAAKKLVQLNADQRAQLAKVLSSFVGLNASLPLSLTRLYLLALAQTPPPPDAWLGALLDFRRALVKLTPGVAMILGAVRQLSEPTLNQLGETSPRLDEDDFYDIESNVVAGAISLYGEPTPLQNLPDSYNQDVLAKLKGARVGIQVAVMGTVQLRGNEVVRLAVSADMLQAVVDAVINQKQWLLDSFSRVMLTDNVVEGTTHSLIGRQVTLSTNDFTGFSGVGGQAATGVAVGVAARLVAAAVRGLYMGNVADSGLQIFSAALTTDQAVNQGVTIQ